MIACKTRGFGRKSTGLAAALVLVLAFVPTASWAEGEAAVADGTAADASVPASESGAPASESGAAVAEKTEVVYASLSDTGEPLGAYVVNRFDVETGGLLVDFGDYDYGKNLTSGEDISFEDGATMVNVEEGTFYYQGNTGPIALPWKVSISYELDGQPVDSQDLAGGTGRLVVRVRTSQDTAVNSAFYQSFMLQVTFTLDGERCRSIDAPGATVAAAGADKTVAFTVLPNREGDCTLIMDVDDFEMDGIQIVGLPYTSPIAMPDTSDMTSGLEELSSAVGKLAGGAGQLASGARELSGGASSAAEGMTAVGDGLDALAATGETLDAASSAMGQAISAQSDALGQMSAALEGAATASGDPQLQQMAASLQQMASGMAQLDGQYGQFQEGLSQYIGGTTAMAGNFGQLEEGTRSLAAGASSLAAGADELASGARTMERETAKLPQRMQSEIDRMTADFDFPEFVPVSFMSSKNTDVEAVQFVMTTAAIEKPAPDEPEAAPAQEETIIDRFLALFGL